MAALLPSSKGTIRDACSPQPTAPWALGSVPRLSLWPYVTFLSPKLQFSNSISHIP